MLSLLVVLAAQAAAAAPPDGPSPQMVRQPSAYERAVVFTDRTGDRQLAGRVVMRCRVTSIGTLADCAITSETPKGSGLGKAAMALRSKYRFTPPKPGQNPWVEIPLAFDGGKYLMEGDPNR